MFGTADDNLIQDLCDALNARDQQHGKPWMLPVPEPEDLPCVIPLTVDDTRIVPLTVDDSSVIPLTIHIRYREPNRKK